MIRKIKKKIFSEKSYSQCGEDRILEFLFTNFLKIPKPSYIDIGAHHPSYLNNTKIFYEKGSRGINIEPNPLLIKYFHLFRSKDTNLCMGISDSKAILDYYMMSVPTMNTFSQSEAKELDKNTSIKIKKIIKVKTDNVKNILTTYFNGIFPDLLTIDVEGVEMEILNSIDYKSNYPKVICIETLSYSEKDYGAKDKDLIDFISNKGYILYADTYINTIFVKEELFNKKNKL